MDAHVRTEPTPQPLAPQARILRTLLALALLTALPLSAVQHPALVGQHDALVVLGPDATTTLRSGDVLFLQATTPKEIQVGDIVVRQLPNPAGGLTVGEVTAIEPGAPTQLHVSGSDEPVDPTWILGRVELVLPAYGHLLLGASELPDAHELGDRALEVLTAPPGLS